MGPGVVVWLVWWTLQVEDLTWSEILASPSDVNTILSGWIAAGLALVFFGLNRLQKIPSWLTSGLFLVLLMVVFAFADPPEQLVAGESTSLFFLPVLLAAVLLRPAGCIVFAFLACIELALIAPLAGPSYDGPPAGLMGTILISSIPLYLAGSMIERSLQETRQLSAQRAAILNAIPDGILLVDPDGRILVSNPAATRLLRPIPLDDCHDLDALSSGPGRRLIRVIQAMARGTIDHREQLQHASRTLSLYSAPVETLGRVLVLHDISREAEADRAKSTILALASHELRTPLANVLGYAQLSLETLRPSSRRIAEHLARIVANAERMADTITSISILAQSQANALEIHLQPLETPRLLQILHQAIQPLLTIAQRKGLDVRFDSALPDRILCDADRLQTVFLNLVSNAVKYTRRGRIRLRLFCPDPQHWSISVQDSGSGIPKHELPKLFKSFRLAGQHYATRSTQGAGLGLAVVKQLVDRMGGRVDVRSSPGRGSHFSVTLPLQESPA
jgi:signal transduction histidine kinase